MKKVIISLQVAAALMITAVSAQAADSVTLPFSASVQSVLELGVEIREFKDGSVTNWGASAMHFGHLKSDAVNGPMRGEYYFDVYLHPNSSSRPFRLTQSANALSNGTSTIPAGACVVTPWPVDKNGQSYPAGATLGTRGSFIGTNKIIYQSEPAGSYVPVAFTYAITNDPTAGAAAFVPFDQAGGDYSSTITFQIELVA